MIPGKLPGYAWEKRRGFMPGISRTSFRVFCCCIMLVSSGCSQAFRSVPSGAVAGGLLGAGTGAVVGAVIASGDIAASALLGAALGVPAGIVTAIMVQKRSESARRQRLQEEIERNQRTLRVTEDELALRRQEQLRRAPVGPTSTKNEDPIYVGETLANPYR